jgi:S1-C subfamily serine protease
LITKGRVVRPSLGLVAISLTPQVAYANDLPIERGALVVRVDAGGPAVTTGIEPGDVVTSVGASRSGASTICTPCCPSTASARRST